MSPTTAQVIHNAILFPVSHTSCTKAPQRRPISMSVLFEQFSSNENNCVECKQSVTSGTHISVPYTYIQSYRCNWARIRITNEPQFNKKYFRPITVRLLYVIFSAHLQIHSTLNLSDITSKSRRRVCKYQFNNNVSNII